MSLPKGHSAKNPSFQSWMPKGIPIIVRQVTSPARISQNRLPKKFIIRNVCYCPLS